MLDGPVVAGIVFAGGAVLVGGYLYIEYARHGRSTRHADRVPERLPLFGVPAGEATDASRPAASMPRPNLAPRRPTLGDAAAGGPHMSSPASGTPVVGAPYPAPYPGGPAYGTSGVPVAGPNGGYVPAPTNGRHTPDGAMEAIRSGAVGMPFGAPIGAPAFGSPRFADGQTLRFALPDAGTLQFLPGRLQVVVGPETGREIRFVRSPDTGETDVTFGRSEGPPHRHVQLLVPTVSRRHAVMSLIDEHWSLQNLSATNPVTLNGRRLAPDEVVPLLVDGDRIEMGEVVFVFHSR